MCSKIWSVNCTFHYARSQLYQILTSRWNISIKIHQTHFKIAKLRCQLWKDSRSRRLPPLFKTHAPSLRESFTHSEISRAEVQMLLSSRRHSLRVPRKWNLQSIKNPLLSACHADQPHFNNPVTHEESCTTCQAVAVGLCRLTMRTHVSLSNHQASSVLSARFYDGHRKWNSPVVKNTIGRRSFIDASFRASKKQDSAKHPHPLVPAVLSVKRF